MSIPESIPPIQFINGTQPTNGLSSRHLTERSRSFSIWSSPIPQTIYKCLLEPCLTTLTNATHAPSVDRPTSQSSAIHPTMPSPQQTYRMTLFKIPRAEDQDRLLDMYKAMPEKALKVRSRKDSSLRSAKIPSAKDSSAPICQDTVRKGLLLLLRKGYPTKLNYHRRTALGTSSPCKRARRMPKTSARKATRSR
jgi:hypothetical protein